MPQPHLQLPAGVSLPSERPLIMGIVNVTPDSFSDGGQWFQTRDALAHAQTLVHAGADIIDIGGESTRPGSTRIDPDEEWRRIGDVVRQSVDAGFVVSVDTLHARTARRAIDAGAHIINDVSGGRWDCDMNAVIADSDAAYVIQRFRALPGQLGESFDYGSDVLGSLIDVLASQVDDAVNTGVDAQRIVVDPGLGFSLTPEQCWEIVEHVDRFHVLGYPVLVGASRKRFLSLRGEDKDQLSMDVARFVAAKGVWAVRVHDVQGHVEALGLREAR